MLCSDQRLECHFGYLFLPINNSNSWNCLTTHVWLPNSHILEDLHKSDACPSFVKPEKSIDGYIVEQNKVLGTKRK